MGAHIKGIRTIDIRNLMDSQNAPNVKQYLVYDVEGDPTDIYFAQASAQAGDTCLRQRFEYATVSGIKNPIKIGWEDATWSGAAWDLA